MFFKAKKRIQALERRVSELENHPALKWAKEKEIEDLLAKLGPGWDLEEYDSMRSSGWYLSNETGFGASGPDRRRLLALALNAQAEAKNFCPDKPKKKKKGAGK